MIISKDKKLKGRKPSWEYYFGGTKFKT